MPMLRCGSAIRQRIRPTSRPASWPRLPVEKYISFVNRVWWAGLAARLTIVRSTLERDGASGKSLLPLRTKKFSI